MRTNNVMSIAACDLITLRYQQVLNQNDHQCENISLEEKETHCINYSQ